MSQFLIKYEPKSARVKGLAFHPKRKWLLVSLHNGEIQLHDYAEKTLIDKFKGHEGPVRGLDFHKHQPLFVSGSDDNFVKVWNYKTRRCLYTNKHLDYVRTTFFHHEHPWMVSASDDQTIQIHNWQSRTLIATLAGHTNYVMCAVFHPTGDLLLSASADSTLRLWDISNFKVRSNSSTSRGDISLPEVLTRADCSVVSQEAHMRGVNWCSFHPTKDLCVSSSDDNYVKVWRIDPNMGLSELYTLRGHYNEVECVIFHPRANYILSASVDRSLRIWDMDKRIPVSTKRRDIDRFWKLAAHPHENLFAAGHDSGLMIFKLDRERPKQVAIEADPQAKKLDAKYSVISCDRRLQAFVGKNCIKICDGQLNILTTITEQRKIKSTKWDPSGVLIYNTPVHVKYALLDGHCTTICSVQETLYIVNIKDDKVHCVNRRGQTKLIPIDSREFKFKQAVVRGDRAGILNSLRQLKNLSRAEISFLVKKGYPGLALKYIKDAESRFPLAIQAFDVDSALEAAIKLKKSYCWETLAEVALQIGHVHAAEQAYIELRQPYRLAILYLSCGQRDKIHEARALARELGDTSSEFMISLLIKDYASCVQVIRKHYPNLAYTCAVNHGLYELALEISQELSEEQLKTLPSLETAYNQESDWMHHTTPDILSESPFDNWPLLDDDEENFTLAANDDDDELEELEPDIEEGGDWGDDESRASSEKEKEEELEDLDNDNEDDEEAGWSDGEPLEDLVDDDEEDGDVTIKNKSEQPKVEAKFVPPQPGPSVTASWTRSSNVALHHVLAGSFKSAFGLLETQIGATNAQLEPLQKIFKDLFLQSRAAYQASPLLPTYFIHPLTGEKLDKNPLPAGGYSDSDLDVDLKESYDLVTKGKFGPAIDNFRCLLIKCLFLKPEDSESPIIDRAYEIIGICREYIIALQVWGERKRITEKETKSFEDNKRACELAAYFAKLKLHRKHRSIVLEQALKVFRARPKEFQKTHAAAVIARRLLEVLDPNDSKKKDTIAFAERVKASEDIQVDQELKLDYDDKNPYNLCAVTFKPIYKGNQITECPLCDAKYKPDHSGQLCKVCQLSEVGKHATGIQLEVTRD